MAQERKIPFKIQAFEEITQDSGRQAFLPLCAPKQKRTVFKI